MRKNLYASRSAAVTHEGAPADNVPSFQALRRSVMTCLLWEDTFYESGEKIADRIERLCQRVTVDELHKCILESYDKHNLRHIPLFLIIQLLKRKENKAKTLIKHVCERPDQATELLNMYWQPKKIALSKQLQKGLAMAFQNWDEYQLAKWDRDTPVKLRDVLFLSHAKPSTSEQKAIWEKLINKNLDVPNTWEVRLSAGHDKKETFTDLLLTRKIHAQACLMNARNMFDSGVDPNHFRQGLRGTRKILPFQYMRAAKACPGWENIIEEAMLSNLGNFPKLPGKTLLMVDNSGSMMSNISGKGQTTCADAACGLAILLREICEDISVFGFSDDAILVPSRRGFALKDAIQKGLSSGTYIGRSLIQALAQTRPVPERIIIITDGQSHDPIPHITGDKCYIINVQPYEKQVKTENNWITINGFSENTVRYIQELENMEDENVS